MQGFKKGRLSKTEITQWLTELRENSCAPASGFAVTAVFRAGTAEEDDYYFAGVNVENIDHRLTIHAEEGCIAAMVTGLGCRARIVEGWVMGGPKGARTSDTLVGCCGKCRQQIAGFAGEGVKIHSLSLNGATASTTVGAFLPDPFTFLQYMPEGFDATKINAAAPSRDAVKKRLTRQGPLSEQEIVVWLKDIESIDYVSKVSQSIVLQLDNGVCVAGSKIEEAAFVSLNAAQSAVAIVVSAFGARKVQKAWVYTKGRDGAALPSGNSGVLTMSALQTLAQLAESDEIPIRFIADDSPVVQATLAGASRHALSVISRL